jgi:uncharacterized membrane protein
MPTEARNKVPERLLLDLVLYPHQSLTATGFAMIMVALGRWWVSSASTWC